MRYLCVMKVFPGLVLAASLLAAMAVHAAGGSAEPHALPERMPAPMSLPAPMRLPGAEPAVVPRLELQPRATIQVVPRGPAPVVAAPEAPRDQRRVELRQALQPQRQPAPAVDDAALQSRQLSAKERMEMRQLLRQQRRDAELAKPS